MTLAELGAKLREAREARGLSVADAADYLKIPSRILEGAEEGAEHLPRTVYVYHFIKDYAKYLGFSASEAGTMLSSVDGFENISRPVLAESAPFTPVKPSIVPDVIGAVLKLVVVAALAFGAYTAYVHFFAGRDYDDIVKLPSVQESAPAAPSAPSSAAPQAAPVWEPAPEKSSASPTSSAQPAPLKEEAPAAAPAAEPHQEKTEAVGQAPQWDAPAAAEEQNAAAEPAVTQVMAEEAPAVSQSLAPVVQVDDAPASAPASGVAAQPAVTEAVEQTAQDPVMSVGDQRVEVIADGGDCWMGFEADGRKQQRFLRKGASFMLSFRDSLVLKLGDAGAVRVLHNGKELERAASGRVLTLRFPQP